MQHVFAMANHVTALLNGATDPDPSQHGMTTEEERASSSKPQVLTLCGRGGLVHRLLYKLTACFSLPGVLCIITDLHRGIGRSLQVCLALDCLSKLIVFAAAVASSAWPCQAAECKPALVWRSGIRALPG